MEKPNLMRLLIGWKGRVEIETAVCAASPVCALLTERRWQRQFIEEMLAMLVLTVLSIRKTRDMRDRFEGAASNAWVLIRRCLRLGARQGSIHMWFVDKGCLASSDVRSIVDLLRRK